MKKCKKCKVADLPKFAIYEVFEAPENEKYHVYYRWTDNHPEYGYIRQHKKLMIKDSSLPYCLEFIADFYRSM